LSPSRKRTEPYESVQCTFRTEQPNRTVPYTPLIGVYGMYGCQYGFECGCVAVRARREERRDYRAAIRALLVILARKVTAWKR